MINFAELRNMNLPGLNDIIQAYQRIKPFIHRTPIMSSRQINSIVGAEIFFKCENFQKTGAFKFRGATNAVQLLTREERRRGVITHSSGNHAAALALAAENAGVKTLVVMPSNAPEVKKNAVKGYGAEITFCEPTQAARESATNELIAKTGAVLIHPYDNYNIICGQGTAALELIEEIPGLHCVIAPVGGGGLLSGTSTAARGMAPALKIYGAEPLNVNDAYLSFSSGVLHPAKPPATIADGLLTSLSSLTFEIVRKNVDDILTVKEDTIIECMQLIWERMKIVAEPSSAVALAAIKENIELFSGKRTGLILSGGNVELSRLPFRGPS